MTVKTGRPKGSTCGKPPTNPVPLPRKLSGACISYKRVHEAVLKYFRKCDAHGEKYTITGLALALDLSDHTLRKYVRSIEEHDLKGERLPHRAVASVLKRAQMRVVESYEKDLRTKVKPIGPMFALKSCAKWRDNEVGPLTDASGQIAPTVVIQLTQGQQQQVIQPPAQPAPEAVPASETPSLASPPHPPLIGTDSQKG